MRGDVVFGLAEQVGGDPVGVVRGIGDDDDLRRAGDHVDADDPVDLALGLRDPGVARAGDDVDVRDAAGAVGECSDALRAADPPQLVDPGEVRGGEDEGIDRATRRRGHHHQPSDAGDARGDGVHQQRGGIGGAAAGDVDARRIDRQPARAEANAGAVRIIGVCGSLALVIGADAGRGEVERDAQARIERFVGGGAIGSVDAPAGLVRVVAIKGAGEIGERCFAFCADAGDDRGDIAGDIGRGFAAVVDEGGEAGGEVGGGGVEADHCGIFTIPPRGGTPRRAARRRAGSSWRPG